MHEAFFLFDIRYSLLAIRSFDRAKGEFFMTDDIHEVYAIRYAHHDRKAAENYIHGDPHDILQPLDYYVWAIVGTAGAIVLDTGFDAAMGKKRQREMLKPIGDGLKAIGIDPAAVETVIVTCRIARWPTPPGAACATRRYGCRSRLTTWWRWCASCSTAASPFTTARTRSCPASPSTTSAATPRACRACG
jgi:hypothetical protein